MISCPFSFRRAKESICVEGRCLCYLSISLGAHWDVGIFAIAKFQRTRSVRYSMLIDFICGSVENLLLISKICFHCCPALSFILEDKNKPSHATTRSPYYFKLTGTCVYDRGQITESPRRSVIQRRLSGPDRGVQPDPKLGTASLFDPLARISILSSEVESYYNTGCEK